VALIKIRCTHFIDFPAALISHFYFVPNSTCWLLFPMPNS